MSMGRCMQYTCPILNRCPHRILKDKALKEAFISENSKISNFCVLRCFTNALYSCYDRKSTKLGPLSIRGIFLVIEIPPRLTSSIPFNHNGRHW